MRSSKSLMGRSSLPNGLTSRSGVWEWEWEGSGVGGEWEFEGIGRARVANVERHISGLQRRKPYSASLSFEGRKAVRPIRRPEMGSASR